MEARAIETMTVAEFLEFEAASDVKHEYFRGQVTMMAGATARHNLIKSATTYALQSRLRGRGCFFFTSDQMVNVESAEFLSYPDIILVCGMPRFADDKELILLNPHVIIEVLSPSTERDDRGRKRELVQQIPSLTDYILISQSNYHLEHCSRRRNNQWTRLNIVGQRASLNLSSLGCQIALEEIYEQAARLSGF